MQTTTSTVRCARPKNRCERRTGARRPRSPLFEDDDAIRVHGAREHNLKNISLDIPARQDGRHHRPERLRQVDPGLRHSLCRRPAPLSSTACRPTRGSSSSSWRSRTSISSKASHPPWPSSSASRAAAGKSTVATVTEVYHFLRLLFRQTGTQFCPECDLPVEKQSLAAIVKQVETRRNAGRSELLAPLVKARKGFHTDVARWAERQGFDTLLSMAT